MIETTPEPQITSERPKMSSINSGTNERLKNELTFYQREYEKLLNRPTYEHVSRKIF